MSDRDTNVEILALRHQIAVLERQLGKNKVRFTPSDRAFLAALLHRLPLEVLHRLRLLVRPDTVLRSPPRPGPHAVTRPSPNRSAQDDRAPSAPSELWCCAWARRTPAGDIAGSTGELLVPGVKVAASTIGEILQAAGVDPAPGRNSSTWADFLRSQAHALLACDFFETVTLSGARMYVLVMIEHASRRIRILGATTHPTASWVAQAAKNLVMDLEDAGSRAGSWSGIGTGSSPPCSIPSSRIPGSRSCSAASRCRK
ncbi:hypothetical protein SAMN05216215_10817 [Saccharopolyspora shandongensis]|uniref:Uncharacterized protein n=2 Tax=Saccharopolyspora shandongensis TaxID=418495 RepID=A0A1H3TF91_9PSEU|nr:hypothetical protein SAMN05216215_10817 [Saccharopolyspora shandongensis]